MRHIYMLKFTKKLNLVLLARLYETLRSKGERDRDGSNDTECVCIHRNGAWCVRASIFMFVWSPNDSYAPADHAPCMHQAHNLENLEKQLKALSKWIQRWKMELFWWVACPTGESSGAASDCRQSTAVNLRPRRFRRRPSSSSSQPSEFIIPAAPPPISIVCHSNLHHPCFRPLRRFSATASHPCALRPLHASHF